MNGPAISRRTVLGTAAVAGAGAVGAVGLTGFGAAQAATAPALDDTMASDAAWASYLGGLDPVWTKVPTNFYQGAFLGNGGLGTAVYQTGRAKKLTLRLNDSRVR